MGQLGGSGPYSAKFGDIFRGFQGVFIVGPVSQVFPCCSELLGGLWGVLCSLGRQGATHRRAKGLRVGAITGKEGCQGQVRGIRAVLGQFGGVFRVFRRVFISEPVSQVFPYCSGPWGNLWGVLCSLGRQGGTNRRAKCLRVGATRDTEGCQGQVGGFRAVLGQFGGVFRFFLGDIYLGGLYPTLFLAAFGRWGGCGVSCALWGGKGAPIEGQNVLG